MEVVHIKAVWGMYAYSFHDSQMYLKIPQVNKYASLLHLNITNV